MASFGSYDLLFALYVTLGVKRACDDDDDDDDDDDLHHLKNFSR